jgi:DNA-binding NarL/FixJ family response regulator
MTTAAIRILIVDDHDVVREGLQTFLAEEEDVVVVGEASNGLEAVNLATTLRPQVILMDLLMPGMDGVEATRRIRALPGAPQVLVLTSYADHQHVRDAVQAGAIGYILKDVLRHDLVQAIRHAAEGRPTLHPEAQRQLIQQVVAPPPTLIATLTERERDVLDLIARGRSNKEIANELHLTEGTVKGYVSAILAKLGVADRTQAALYAVKHGLGSPA